MHFSGAEKEGEAVCGSQQFFSSSFAAEKKGRQIIQVFFSIEERQPDNLFFGYIFSERFSYSDQIQRTVFG